MLKINERMRVQLLEMITDLNKGITDIEVSNHDRQLMIQLRNEYEREL